MDNYTQTLNYTSATARGSEEEWTWILILMMASLLLALGGSLRQFQHVFRFPARAPLPLPRGEGERGGEYKLVSTRNVSVENERYARAVLAFSRSTSPERRGRRQTRLLDEPGQRQTSFQTQNRQTFDCLRSHTDHRAQTQSRC